MSTDVRPLLENRLRAVLARHAKIQDHLRQQDGRLEADFEDRASLTQGDEVLEDLDDAGRREIVAIRAALGRLDAGTYGVCAACGDDINPERLHALPETAFCVKCAERVG